MFSDSHSIFSEQVVLQGWGTGSFGNTAVSKHVVYGQAGGAHLILAALGEDG